MLLIAAAHVRRAFRVRTLRHLAYGLGGFAMTLALLACVLVWRLSSGPISLDLATPWLLSAIEQNLGNRYQITIGGTQLERDSDGRSAVRLRDVALRDVSGKLVASAPKAEVGIAGTSLFMARPRAESIRLVEANLLVRVETDGRINIFAGGEEPLVSLAPDASQAPSIAAGTASAEPGLLAKALAGLAMAERLGAAEAGFDGGALDALGVLKTRVAIEDLRSGHRWAFDDLNMELARTRGQVLSLKVGSTHQRKWSLAASLTPRAGARLVEVTAEDVLLDDLLALRIERSAIRSDTRLSGQVKAIVQADGTIQTLNGGLHATGGSIGEAARADRRMPIQRADLTLDWDHERGTLRFPLTLTSAATRLRIQPEIAAPRAAGQPWLFAIGDGSIALDRTRSDVNDAVSIRRVLVKGRYDPAISRLMIDQGDIASQELGGARGPNDVRLSLSGTLDAGKDGKLTLGVAGDRISAAAFRRVWPRFIAPDVRQWIEDHVLGGTVERFDIATAYPFAALFDSQVPVQDDALAITIALNNAALRPVDGLPTITDADITARVTGHTATVSLGKGVSDVAPGKRLAVSGGVFEVPDVRPAIPLARVRLRVDGPVPAAAELLNYERIRDFAGTPFDPTVSRGTVSAQISLAMPMRANLPRGSTSFNIAADIQNFAAEKMAGQKIEGGTLRITAHNQAVQIRGDMRINGIPAQVEYRKNASEPDAELRLSGLLDEALRARLGMEIGNSVVGAIPVKLTSRLSGSEPKDARFAVEADLTPVKIDGLLPGWIKDRGKPARVTFNLVRDRGNRLEDLLVDGQGVLAKGTIELDANGDLQSANFPVFATSDGDKATLTVNRAADGLMKVVMRGDVYDGRGFVKSSMAGTADAKAKSRSLDLDIDVKLGVVAGHNGETLRGVDLKMLRRAGRIRSFTLNGRVGRDTALTGDLRARPGRPQVLYVETADAGALFRFTDVYPRMTGGRVTIAMDPPTAEGTPQEGLIQVRDFTVRGESSLDRVTNQQGQPVAFSQAQAEFTKTPGRLVLRDGIVRGPTVGATIEGNLDYVRDDANLRGTFVPLYGLNNMFGQIPIVGLFLGGSREGLLGLTFEVTGPTGNPRVAVNPLSAIAPGLLRKFFEFRDTTGNERSFADPGR